MHLIRKNPFTKKHYRYDTDDVNIFTDMFDDELHNSMSTPEPEIDRYTCGYCQTMFESRNQLFYHLGYMGIDIRKCRCSHICDCSVIARRQRKRYYFQKRKRRYVDGLTNTLKSMKI
jgi:hypothetical protein